MPRFETHAVMDLAPAALYEIVTDVAAYPEFLPWCQSAKILEKTDSEILADLTVGTGPFVETFQSRVKLTPFEKIEVHYEKGPLKKLYNHWIFKELTPEKTNIHFLVDFEFHSFILNKMMENILDKAAQRMMSAFQSRVRTRSQ